MKNSIYIYIAAVSLVLCALAGISCAQGSQGDTSLTYDDQTGLVTGYAETTNDLDTDYTTDATLGVVDQNNVVVASTNALRQTGTASVTLQFEGTPGSVYTATASHCLRLETSDYNSAYPWGVFYYDNWYMSSLIAQQINSQ